jgi:hypothetical protein
MIKTKLNDSKSVTKEPKNSNVGRFTAKEARIDADEFVE